MAAEHKGQDHKRSAELTNKAVVDALRTAAGKLHCSVLAEEAVKSAIADYRRQAAKSTSISAVTDTVMPATITTESPDITRREKVLVGMAGARQHYIGSALREQGCDVEGAAIMHDHTDIGGAGVRRGLCCSA